MTFFLASLKTNVKRLLRPSTAFSALVLVLALLIGGYVQKELFLQARIGVLFADDTIISQEITDNLKSFSNISIKQYDNFDSLMNDVVAVKVECGYVFDENIDGHIKSGSINRAVKLYKSKSTLADGFTNELVFAALLKTASPYISADYLRLRTGGDYNDILDEAKQSVKSYYESGIFMDLDVTTVGEEDAYSAGKTKNRINAGIVSVFLFIMFFYITIGAIEEKKTGVYEKLAKTRVPAYLLSYVLAYAITLFIIVSVIFAPGGEFTRVITVTFIYIAFLSALCFAAASLFKSARALYAIFPFVSVAVIVLGGAFFDAGEFIPVLDKISRFFPTYYYVLAI